MTALGAQLAGLAAAFRFLTCLPLPPAEGPAAGLPGALPYFPLVGLAIGAILLGLDGALSPLLARPLVDFALLVGFVWLSGGLHLDGLIDTADALPAPGSPAQRLTAMRESWAGPRGAISALAQLLLQYAALESLPGASRSAALLLAPTLGRWANVYGYVGFPYARRTVGLSLALKQGANPRVALAATLIYLAAAWPLIGPPALLLLGGAWLTTQLVGQIALRQLGGMSGDVYGAVTQVVETFTLLLLPLATTLGR